MTRPFLSSLALVTVLAGGSAADAGAAIPNREADPVVLTGADLPGLLGSDPGRIVAFSRGASGWKQVPVQVDERAVVDYRVVRQTTGFGPFSALAYTDPGTYAGADPDPALDSDDEVAAMARDSGDRADAAADPSGVDAGTRTKLAVTDPLDASSKGYLYLYRSTGSLDPSAGKSYVDYRFRLNSGDYKSTYDWNGVADDGGGPPANQENSTVTTPFYSQHLLARWVEDELHITAGGASGVDILDGDKAQVSRGCGRSELTFSRGGGGFIVHRSGPVRAIRSYIGANSGTFTQRDHIYYDRADVTKTYLRVHPGITTISQFYDYSAAASGMTYRNSLNPSGVTIDGATDAVTAGFPQWEQVSGPQGTASIVSRVVTDLPGFSPGSYYLDDASPPVSVQQCGGYADALAYGSSGPEFTSSGANTDPTLGAAYSLTATRTTSYDGPGGDATTAALRAQQVDSPLQVSTGTGASKLRLKLDVKRVGPLRPGHSVRLRVKVSKKSGSASEKVRICGAGKRRFVKVGACEKLDHLAGGKAEHVALRVKLRRGAAGRKSVKVKLEASGGGARAGTAAVRIQVAGG